MVDSSPTNQAIELLKIAQTIRDYHHRALWEEERHFTWLLWILITGMAGVFLVSNLDKPTKAAVVLGFASLGATFSLLAYRVVRREGVYFHDANIRFMLAHARCYPEMDLLPLAAAANKPVLKLLWVALSGRAGVRDIFQLIFITFLIAFAVVLIVALCTLSPTGIGRLAHAK